MKGELSQSGLVDFCLPNRWPLGLGASFLAAAWERELLKPMGTLKAQCSKGRGVAQALPLPCPPPKLCHTLIVASTTSMTPHCLRVRPLASSRMTWSWKRRSSTIWVPRGGQTACLGQREANRLWLLS